MLVTETGYHRNTLGCGLQKLGNPGTNEDVVYRKLGITGTHEDVGYRNWVYPEHMKMGRLQKLEITGT